MQPTPVEENKACKTGAGNSLDDTGTQPGRPGNSQGVPGNAPDDAGNVPVAMSHSRGA